MAADPNIIYKIYLTAFVFTATFTGALSQTGSCYIFGTQHVFTFDQQKIDFNSNLKFLIAQTCPPSVVVDAAFEISIINDYKYHNIDSASQVQCVEIVYKTYTCRICADQTASVNGDPVVDSIETSNRELMIYYGTRGRELAIHVLGTAVRVSITEGSTVTVTVPDSYKDKLCGLCGDYDGNAENDLLLANGQPPPGIVNNYIRGAQIAESYLTPAHSGARVLPFFPSSCEQTEEESLIISGPEMCGIYEGSGSEAFLNCFNQQPNLAEAFLAMCTYDYCENYLTSIPNENTTSACENNNCQRNEALAKSSLNSLAEVFVEICKNSSSVIGNDWRTEYNAPLTCSHGIYSPEGPYCPNVCGLQANRCHGIGLDGCICENFEWKEGEACVPLDTCGCSDLITGDYYKVGEWWLDNLCTRNYTCEAPDSRNSQQLFCSENSLCTSTGCTCKIGYDGDGLTCDKTCPVGEHAVQDECELCPVGTYKEAEGTGDCVLCGRGQVTDDVGSSSLSDCQDIEIAPEASNHESYSDVYDLVAPTIVPTDVLPNGLPYGPSKYRNIYVSTNGVVSFGDPYTGRDPMNLEMVQKPLLAPFWFRQDLRLADQFAGFPNFSGLSRFSRSVTNERVEVTVSQFNKLNQGEALQKETGKALEQIQILLQSSDKVLSSFTPNFAIVVNWKNISPYPSAYYSQSESLSYQCVIVTDGSKTYAIYVYLNGRLALAPFQQRSIYMGYNSGDFRTQFNYYKSGQFGMELLDREPSNTNVPGRWVFEVSNFGMDSNSVDFCLNWYFSQEYSMFPLVVPDLADPCPCNWWTALFDNRFIFDFNSYAAYSLSRRVSFFGGGYFQKCHYDRFGPLITDPLKAGYPIYHHPLVESQSYYYKDELPYYHCCRGAPFLCSLYRQLRPVDTCIFYRPPIVCGGFGDPHILTLDQHVYTYNPVGEFWMIKSENFSMQARMIRSISSTSNENVPATQFGAFAMHSLGDSSAKVHVEVNNDRTDIEVRVDGELVSTKFISGTEVLSHNGVMLTKNNSISAAFESGFSFRISLSLGVLSIQNFVPESAQGNINGLLGHYDGNVSNDFQNRNGDLVCTANEDCTAQDIHDNFGETWRIEESESVFWYRTGFTSSSYTDREFQPLYPTFSQTETMGADFSVCDNDYECMFDIFLTNDTELGKDTQVTKKDVETKSNTLSAIVPFIFGVSSLEATIGTPVTAIYSTNYTGNDTVQIFAVFKPENSTFEKIDGEDAYVFSWTPVDQSDYLIQFVANATNNMTDVVSVSPLFDVSVKLSRKCINGEPDFEVTAPDGVLSPTFSLVQCTCYPGWVGKTCETDFDGCVDNLCENGTCVDVNAGEVQKDGDPTYSCNITSCKTGYEFLDINGVVEPDCTDIDECINGTNPCVNADCINSPGSFQCVCKKGYRFETSSTTNCSNIDECELGTDKCHHLCFDVEGFYRCNCNDGYTLSNDGVACTPDNTTVSTTSTTSTTTTTAAPVTICSSLNCTFTCNVTSSSCTCPRGQRLNADGISCDSINECEEATHVCKSVCVDLDIGYECKCPDVGYQQLINDYDTCLECNFGKYGGDCNDTCLCGDRAKVCDHILGCTDCNPGWEGEQCSVDINECGPSDEKCGLNTVCTNTNGSYICTCLDGYKNENSTHCVDIDECETLAPCSRLSKCNNTDGSFTCTCEDGFVGDGTKCSDINECVPIDESPSPCVLTAGCTNEFGSYRCDCVQGYYGDGKLVGTGCENYNECQDAINACPVANSVCKDVEPGFTCPCKEGYKGDEGPTYCDDIDECATTTNFNCTLYATANGVAKCINLNGSYGCDTECNSGYDKTKVNGTDYFTCTPIDECMANPCSDQTETCVDTEDSFVCNCLTGFEKLQSNETCVNIDECATGEDLCAQIANGQANCNDTFGSYECVVTCEEGYMVETSGDVQTCTDIDECELDGCNASSENCANTEGSYQCTCKDGYEKLDDADSCSNINECLEAATCGNGSFICIDLDPFYNCSCKFGWEGPSCEIKISTAEFILVEQVFGGLDFDPDWTSDTSDARLVFNSLMTAALNPMFSSTSAFIGVNILEVSEYSSSSTNAKKKRATSETLVNYDAVYSENVDEADVIHKALDYLISVKYLLTFNKTTITDRLMLAYPGIFNGGEVTCDTELTVDGETRKLIDCQGKGTCEHSENTDYPMCVCQAEYEGYNCGDETGVENKSANLLALWISVAIAGALLLGGLLACTMVMVYQRRQRAQPKVHRYPRPFSGGARAAIFNPTGRMPTEAFNYQFPSGSVRDDLSDSSSTISSGTIRTQHTEGRVGSTVPFAPRWPRAYYAQLGDPDDN